QGTHASLLELGGKYARLWEHSFLEKPAEDLEAIAELEERKSVQRSGLDLPTPEETIDVGR
ncbi:MAG TPA: hypothetical protein VGI42_07160, partial [Chthoniobacterales bacterium]